MIHARGLFPTQSMNSLTREDPLDTTNAYDAVVVVSFGGPEGMDEVIPFLENVLRGRNVPRERMLAVGKHYEMFDGVSPINAQNRKLIAALEQELNANGPRLPIYFGNRNWHPMLADTVAQMRDDGIKNALAFVTSAYSSYSSCRQYLDDIERAQTAAGPDSPRIVKLRAFFNHPGFIEANAAHLKAAVEQIPRERRTAAQVVFTAHSIPETMAGNCDYEKQLLESARLVFESLGEKRTPASTPAPAPGSYTLVFQSRSGSPSQPWLGPDICEYLREAHSLGIRDIVVAPIGFVSDHMEILFDLDTEARTLSNELGINMVRAGTAGTHPAFVKMIRELILERLEPDGERRHMGTFGARSDFCALDCCASR